MRSFFNEFLIQGIGNSVDSPPLTLQGETSLKWFKPPYLYNKFNADAGFINGLVSITVIARNHYGDALGIWGKLNQSSFSKARRSES